MLTLLWLCSCNVNFIILANEMLDNEYVLVYDCTRRDSFTHLATWLTEVETYSTKPGIVKMLVGNKIDKVSIALVTLTSNVNNARTLNHAVRKFCKSSQVVFVVVVVYFSLF